MTPEEMKTWIDNASYEDMLFKWRFAPTGSLWFQGEVGVYFDETIRKKRAEIGEEAAIRASKSVGW